MRGTLRALIAMAAGACAAAAPACGGKPTPSPSPSGLGAQFKAMEEDTRVLREANGAADEVIRAAGDCDAVRPLVPAANARIEEAARKIQTAAARQTLDVLRKKVRDVAENCP